MREANDAMMVVRAELCERLERLRRLPGRPSDRDFHDGVHAIRRLAAEFGLLPVVRLADAIERASCDCSGPSTLLLDRLGDAIGCERVDDRASEAMLASVSVRFG